MNWNKNIFFLSAVSLSLVLTGCSSMTATQKGAAVGGISGGAVGAFWAQHAHDSTMNSWQGAGAGVVVGALSGALIGDALNEYSGDKVDKDAQINDLQQQLSAAELELANLRNQPGMENVQVEAVNGQIRFTILNEVLFESGKVELKNGSKTTLDSVLTIIENDFADRVLYIEGHTDTDPIKKSKWSDNWELSYGRSMSVLKYFVNEKMISPEKVVAVACGEFHPVVPNDSAANKRMNRRAVIVVMPAADSIVVDQI